MLGNLIRDPSDSRMIRLNRFSYYPLDASYDTQPFSKCSGKWLETVKHEAKQRVEDANACFFRSHNFHFFKNSPEKRTTLYVRVSNWWRKYEPSLVLLVSTRQIVACKSVELFSDMLHVKSLYLDVVCDNCDVVMMAFFAARSSNR